MTEGMSISPTVMGVQEAEPQLDQVLELFQQGKLLVRVMEMPSITKGAQDFELDNHTWEEELGFMSSETGMPHASTTLIVPGKRIPLYMKPYGFLFNGDQVAIEHVAATDSGSSTSADGGLWANHTDLHTLDDLRRVYEGVDGAQSMNEVNICVHKEAIVGLVIKAGARSAATMLGLEISRQYLSHVGVEVSVYAYDDRTGSLNRFALPPLKELLAQLRPTARPVYERKLAEFSDQNGSY